MYLYLPKKGQPPYQTVLFMPGSGAWDARTTCAQVNPQFSFFVRSGRAVAFPIYKGSYERSSYEYNGGDNLKSTSLWRGYVIYFSKDLRRTVDHLATRTDIDPGKIGFFGHSRYDYNFPDESSSLPFFNALGTPADQRRRVVYDTGHNLPPNESFRETLDWFDRYLGPPC